MIHLVLDNASIHRPKRLEEFIAQEFPDATVILHWLPVRSSWLNQIENYFSKIQTHVLTPNNYDSGLIPQRNYFGSMEGSGSRESGGLPTQLFGRQNS
ncbi:transposase [bacterium]|nr:transposase [bacterium]